MKKVGIIMLIVLLVAGMARSHYVMKRVEAELVVVKKELLEQQHDIGEINGTITGIVDRLNSGLREVEVVEDNDDPFFN